MKTTNSTWSANEIKLIKTTLINTLEERRDLRIIEEKRPKSLQTCRSQQAMS